MNRRTEEEKNWFRHVNYAHRGLYEKDQSVPENSLEAFRRAAEAHYGVELDVQLSKDGHVMVFHDDSLKRMCGKDCKIWDLTLEELKELRLKGTDSGIPLFKEVLDVLKDGAGPLIVELKTGPKNDELAFKTYELLKAYPGVYCIESFNPFLVNWFRKNAPEVFRGQLSTKSEGYQGYPKPVRYLLSTCRFSFLNRPDFIAYDRTAEIPKKVQKLRKKGVLLVAWTARDESLKEETEQAFDAVIFEHYRPVPKY